MVIRRNFSVCDRSFQAGPNNGCLRQQENSSTGSIHVLASRPSGSSSGCSNPSLGSGVIRFSPSAIDYQDLTEDNERGAGSGDDCSTLADSNMVVTDTGDVDCSTAGPSQLQNCFNHGIQSGASISSSPCGSTPQGLSDLDVFLTNHLSTGTTIGYKYAYDKFASYCLSTKECSKSCGPMTIAGYLKHLFDEGCSYSTINLARSAISKYHNGYNGVSAGSHKLVCNAIKACFRLRPPLPRYKTTYDITFVLNYLKSLPRNPELSF